MMYPVDSWGAEIAMEDTEEHGSFHSDGTAIEWKRSSPELVLVSGTQVQSLFK